MAFALKPGKPIRRQLIRIVRKELGRSAAPLLAGRSSEAIHEARKSAKKAEAVVALLDHLDAAIPEKHADRLRAARRALSLLRDAKVLIDTFDALRSKSRQRIPEHTAALIRRHLDRARSTSTARARSVARVPQVAIDFRKVRRSARRWDLPSLDPGDLPPVIACSYRASRKAMARASERQRLEDFHDWRKRLKTLWYQLRLAEPLMPGAAETIAQLKRLERTLGEEHDVAVLGRRLESDTPLRKLGPTAAAAKSAVASRQQTLRRDALAQGARLLDDSPKTFKRLLRRRLQEAQASHHRPSRRKRRAA